MSAIKKYGWENFTHEIIASGLSREDACAIERMLIKELNTTNPEYGYNRGFGGETNEGRIVNDETRQKISNSKKGNVHVPDEVRKRISQTLKGRIFTDEHKQKISNALRGENA